MKDGTSLNELFEAFVMLNIQLCALNYLVSSPLSSEKIFAKIAPQGRNLRILFPQHQQLTNFKAFTNKGIQENNARKAQFGKLNQKYINVTNLNGKPNKRQTTIKGKN